MAEEEMSGEEAAHELRKLAAVVEANMDRLATAFNCGRPISGDPGVDLDRLVDALTAPVGPAPESELPSLGKASNRRARVEEEPPVRESGAPAYRSPDVQPRTTHRPSGPWF